MPPEKDPAHWLYRLSIEEWLAAADNELGLCADALGRRAFRPGVTHARRAAGMAWNAVLVARLDGRYGRSYMEHVAALAADQELPDPIRAAAAFLRDTPPAPPRLVPLGRADLGPLDAARALVGFARVRAGAQAPAPGAPETA
jgi:hypothetical protein